MEVGKKYVRDAIIRTCLWITPNGNAVVSDPTYGDYVVPKGYFKHYREYKEPVKHKRWVMMYKNDTDEFCVTYKEKPTTPHKGVLKLLAIKEIEIIEGEGLDGK